MSVSFTLEGVIVFATLFIAGVWMVIDVVSFARLRRRIIVRFKRGPVVTLIDRIDAMFRQRLPVDNDIPALNPNAIAGQANNSLNVVGYYWLIVGPIVTLGIVTIAWILKNNDVATSDLALW